MVNSLCKIIGTPANTASPLSASRSLSRYPPLIRCLTYAEWPSPESRVPPLSPPTWGISTALAEPGGGSDAALGSPAGAQPSDRGGVAPQAFLPGNGRASPVPGRSVGG